MAGDFLSWTVKSGVMYGWVRMQAGMNPDEKLQGQLNMLGYVFLLFGLLLLSQVGLK